MKNPTFSNIDIDAYAKLLQFASRLSRLFSDTATPLIDYRFVEKAFVSVTGSRDLSRQDISFDAVMKSSAGVGVKTFGFNPNAGHKIEKVAEFTTDAKNGEFAGLPPEAIAAVVSSLRNARLQSDAAEVGVNLGDSFYHCVLRVPGGALLHEEEMTLVDLEKIKPLGKNGKTLGRFALEDNDHIRFSDGVKEYTFNRSKNTLMQRFRSETGFTSAMIDLTIQENIWALLMSGEIEDFIEVADSTSATGPVEEPEYVVLPLYSTQSSILKNVPAKSGINQWNAGGRKRSFGEAYIPIPRIVHKLKPGFFPERDQKFKLSLPSGEIVSAKVCQQGSKALMSDPNHALCNWLFATLDGSYSYAESRLAKKMPYTYNDLTKIGKDSVVVRRVRGEGYRFELEFAPIGSYEEFVRKAEDEDAE